MDSIAPNFFVKDMKETIAFYKLLGFDITLTVPDVAPYDWTMMTKGNVNIMLQTLKSLGD